MLRAVTATRYPGADPVLFYDEIARRIADPDLGLFVGLVHDSPLALCLAVLPSSQLMMAPQVALVYSEGRPMLIRHMGDRLRAWLRSEGHDRFMAVNLRHTDAVFVRAARRVGSAAVGLGSLMEVTWRAD